VFYSKNVQFVEKVVCIKGQKNTMLPHLCVSVTFLFFQMFKDNTFM